MNSKHKEILHTHRKFLITNIIWTEDLCKRLQDASLLPDSTVKDIKAQKDRDAKISKLLEVLPVRGAHAYEHFCDVLQLTGHYFLSDFLREEDIVSEKYDAKELYKKMKFLERLKEHEKQELEDYFLEKFRGDSLRMVWKHDFREKAKAIDAKRDQLEQHFTYEIAQKKTKETANQLEHELKDEKENAAVLRSQINIMKQELKDLEAKRMSDLGKQLRYTEVNESVLQRTSKRLELAEKTLRGVNDKISKLITRRQRPQNEKDEMELQKYEFSFVVEDMDIVMESYQDLLLIRRKYNELLEEKDYVLAHMGHTDPATNPTLKDAYRDFVAANDSTMQELENKMLNFQRLVEEQKEKILDMNKEKVESNNKFQLGANVWQAAIMNVMRNQLQDVKKESRVKDTRLKMYENEMSKMRGKISDLEKERELKMKTMSLSGEPKTRLSVEFNGGNSRSPRSTSSISSTAGIDDLELAEDRRRHVTSSLDHNGKPHKESMLPPLKPQIFNSADAGASRSYTPRKNSFRPKPLGAWNKGNNDIGMAPLPDGLTTAPVKFGNRKNQYAQLPMGFGDLKSMSNQGKSKFEKSLGPSTKIRF
ncbi:myosin heavy chain, embryonic smooth muscle isoform-like [Ylistrum balloti]|uniref:myosin heavy chain, embryonic smooth muscle isoform-like n=1 Tax=Ylistrum balloti TaxID=509963 RepID=UPI002905E1D0|nr:myosin heavy chain, embryonic smooth muscle isoform-like [Ylistrum balloti]